MATINVRVDDKLKKEAEEVFKEVGLNLSSAINIFLKKCVNAKGIPFNVTKYDVKLASNHKGNEIIEPTYKTEEEFLEHFKLKEK